jgi:hypothetical protein
MSDTVNQLIDEMKWLDLNAYDDTKMEVTTDIEMYEDEILEVEVDHYSYMNYGLPLDYVNPLWINK